MELDKLSLKKDPKNAVDYHEVENDQQRNLFTSFIQPCLVEFWGSVMFIFVVCTGVCTAGEVWPPFLIGGALFTLIASLGSISGGHYNPAVTFGVLIAGGISPLLALLYTISQLLGATVGAALAKVATTHSVYYNCTGGATLLADEVSLGQAYLTETIVTCFFISVVLMTAVDSRGQTVLAPFAIGFTLTLSIMTAAHISGGSLNPARSFGPALITNTWTDHWLYWLAPLTGSLIASLSYRILFAADDKRWGS